MRTTVTPTGLAAHLVDIRTGGQAARDPLRGGLYENLVILDIPKGPFAQCNTKPAPSQPARTRALQGTVSPHGQRLAGRLASRWG